MNSEAAPTAVTARDADGHGAPAWFREAVGTAPRSAVVAVDGCAIHYLSWGRPGDPGVVCVHGGAAHAWWWSHLGPLLAADGRHVVAIDLSGHGDSGHRERYGIETWADEVRAVAADAEMDAPVLLGHSMGGFVVIAAAVASEEAPAGTIVVDSPARRPDPESQEGRGGRAFREPKTYPDLATAMEHFHLIPRQPPPPGYVSQHVARHSLRQTADGWTWKFDPSLFQRVQRRDPGQVGDFLARIPGPVAVLRGELSGIVDDDVMAYIGERLARPASFVEIPAAHHHLILDQPIAFVAAVRALLAEWRHDE